MKKKFFIVSLLCIFVSCESPFPDFKEIGHENYMQLLSFEEESRNEKWYSASVDIKVFSKDTIIYRYYKEQHLLKEGIFGELLLHLNEGDSALFMLTNSYFKNQFANPYFDTLKDDYFKVFVKVHRFYNEPVEVDREMAEQIILKKYLLENNITDTNQKEGIYVLHQKKEGEGPYIQNGSEIKIRYNASFVNYIPFDDLAKKSFKLTYGTPDQVIKGLEIALKGMRKGEKSKIIIPSQFAFGEEGSSTGIVPPFTTVVYDLEIINVK